LLGTLGSVAAPEVVGLAFLVGQRIPILGMVLLCVLGAGALASLRPIGRAALALAMGLALAASIAHIRGQARRLAAILAPGRVHRPEGRYATAYLIDCPPPLPRWTWGTSIPEWHLSAYALSARGATPYLFAYARYLPVWYRGDAYAARLLGTP